MNMIYAANAYTVYNIKMSAFAIFIVRIKGLTLSNFEQTVSYLQIPKCEGSKQVQSLGACIHHMQAHF